MLRFLTVMHPLTRNFFRRRDVEKFFPDGYADIVE